MIGRPGARSAVYKHLSRHLNLIAARDWQIGRFTPASCQRASF